MPSEKNELSAISLHDLEASRIVKGGAPAATKPLIIPNPPKVVTFGAGEIVSDDQGVYYLIDVMGGKLVKRGFPEADTYHMLMGGAAPAGPFPKAAFDVFAESVDMVPGSFLARGYGNGTVWLVDGGTLRGITSGQAFDQWHFDWQNIVTVPNDTLAKLGPPNPELYISVSSLAVTWNG